MKYKATFIESIEQSLIFTLEIEGDTRTEILSNMLSGNWYQNGHYFVDNDGLIEVINGLIGMMFKDGYDLMDNPDFLYKVKSYADLNLNLRPILKDEDISAKGIIDILCNSIKEYFEYEAAGTTEFTYEIKEI
jgi:hypothetical protein